MGKVAFVWRAALLTRMMSRGFFYEAKTKNRTLSQYRLKWPATELCLGDVAQPNHKKLKLKAVILLKCARNELDIF